MKLREAIDRRIGTYEVTGLNRLGLVNDLVEIARLFTLEMVGEDDSPTGDEGLEVCRLACNQTKQEIRDRIEQATKENNNE